MSLVRVPTVVALCLLATPTLAQQTPGQINDPSTYRGSMANQAAEQAAAAQQQAANQAMQQRLDDNYAAYSPRGGGGGGGAGGGGGQRAKPLKSYPLLPAARNPLLGRWQQLATKPVELGYLRQFPGADVVDAAFAGGCKSLFGAAGVIFTPTQLNWLAVDGHEEVLNHVEYRSDGANVIVLASDGDVPLIFGMPDKDHAVAAFFGCQMRRLAPGVKPVSLNAQPAAAAATAAAAAPAGSAILKLTVGSVINGTFSSPPAGTRFFITSQNPDTNLVRAGFAPAPGGQPIDKLFDACRLNQGGTQERCNQGMQALTTGAVGAAALDMDGHAETGALAPGRYYVVGFTPYQGHSLVWHLAVDLKPGANAVSLTPQNGSLSH
jgi:hypothetical protein